ncbi:MAG: CheR family methyltransferase, partial [Planctomycetota bacterium]
MQPPNDEAFFQRIAARTGLEPDLLDRPSLRGYALRRRSELGLSDEAAFRERLLRDQAELDRFVQEVSVAETWFFRYPASFALLERHADRLRRQGKPSLRTLSVACATGEEPYSMAVALAQSGWPLNRFVVEAFDRHDRSVAFARSARFPQWSFREPLPTGTAKWFHRDGADATLVDSRIAATVDFRCEDVLIAGDPAKYGTYDAVFCRNLFIYLSEAARTRLIEFLDAVLAPDGLLFVGHA